MLAQGRALCGPLADDSAALNPILLLNTDWPPRGALVSERFRDLQKIESIPSGVGIEYPPKLRNEGIEGTVIVSAVLDTTGRFDTTSIRVLSTTHEGFVPAVERYLARSRWRPGQYHERPMRVCIVWPFDFRLPHRR
jgi:TonB family protein